MLQKSYYSSWQSILEFNSYATMVTKIDIDALKI